MLCIWKSVLFRDHPVAPSSEVPSSWLRGPLIGRKQPCHFITLASSDLRHAEETLQQVGEHTVVSFMFYELLSSWSRLRAIHPHTNLDFDVDGFAR